MVLFCTPCAFADGWSIGVGTGPFVFGNFAERTILVGNPGSAHPVTTTLAAATRPGLSVDLQHDLTPALALELDATFTEAPIAIRNRSGDESLSLDAGKIDVGTFSLPLVWRINRSGALRFHLATGPAYAAYRIRRQTGATEVFEGTRGRFGAFGAAGVAWQWTPRFAVEGEISDVVTSSPLERSDFGSSQSGLSIPRPHNVHTTVGLRYRF
ncbi:MAG TPA: hypothetical protein VJ276_19615 [Thermoanaerobaculia bacterium]|nr:hypothetical protein [Thermoanaerobaculia bacterium]